MAFGGGEFVLLAVALGAIGVALGTKPVVPAAPTPRESRDPVPARPVTPPPQPRFPEPPGPQAPPMSEPPSTTRTCLGDVPNGNTVLQFEMLDPAPPPAVRNAIYYQGRLTVYETGFGIGNAVIEFWDPIACSGFDATKTDSDGYYALIREIQPDEVFGYDVFAFFRGAVTTYDPAATHTWRVAPR